MERQLHNTNQRPIKFIQYLRPNGRRTETAINLDNAVADKADALVATGYRLECEMLTTGDVSFTIFDPVQDIDVAIEICANGPMVPLTVEKLIMEFAIP